MDEQATSIDAEPADQAGDGGGASAAKSPAAGGDAESSLDWYVLKVQSNREKSIRDTLIRRIKREGLEEFFGKTEDGEVEVVIPTERVAETKGGKKKITHRKLYPGYIMVHMELTDDTWYLVRDTSGVGDFTGAAGKPIAMLPAEVDRMLGESKPEEGAETAQPKVKIDLTQGEAVKIKEGTFESFEGSIEAIDEEHGKITVLIEIFGRSTPVELEYWQVEKV
jgi:transcriptional antiterminator NusG